MTDQQEIIIIIIIIIKYSWQYEYNIKQTSDENKEKYRSRVNQLIQD